jgi:DNA-directed RNA polymerase III subunit RPC1
MKALEDLAIHYDNTVRNASGCIVQFRYGDDGMDPAYMEGKSGAPLNFDRLFLKAKVWNPALPWYSYSGSWVDSVYLQATCPAGGNEYLSPSEVSERVESRLSEDDMTPEGGCSVAFKNSFKSFLDEYVKSLTKTREAFESVENLAAKENSAIREKIVKNISGVTPKQLEVLNVLFSKFCKQELVCLLEREKNEYLLKCQCFTHWISSSNIVSTFYSCMSVFHIFWWI